MNSGKKAKKILSAMLTGLFLFQQSAVLSALGTEITGVVGNNGVYNIKPTDMITGTDIGYRKYTNFNLSQGDIANLIYEYGPDKVNSFINLVDNQIKIDGIVNTMKGNNFYNGKAIFVSPKGMIVGASGVLNVGSLGIYTPTDNVYNFYKENPHADLNSLKDAKGNALVQINGKAMAMNDIDIHAGQIDIPGKMIAGVNNNEILSYQTRAEQLFESLVNTSEMHKAKSLTNKNGNITFSSEIGTNISGSVKNYGTGDTKITNNGSQGIKIATSGALDNRQGNMKIENYGDGIYIDGEVFNHNGKTEVINYANAIKGLNLGGSFVTTNGDTYFNNEGEEGLNISGNLNAQNDIYLTNTGSKGLNIESAGKVTSTENNINMNNASKGGINIKGLVNAKKDVNIIDKNGDVIIGDRTANNNYVKAGKNININVDNGSILNYEGTLADAKHLGIDKAKTLLVADGDLTMQVNNGTIGLEVGDSCTDGFCTGISNEQGTRDYAKSVNGNIKGVVKASTTDSTAVKNNDYVINYAAIDSDMKIDAIKADGRVILTTDYNTQDGTTRYDMINASTDKTKANVEGWGISLIASKSIGTKENPLTFNQTMAGALRNATNPISRSGYGMDVLANENIYIKGLDDKYTVNNICSMIAREGDLYAEFSGDTYIDEVTSEGALTLITRGKSMEVNHLGTVPRTPVDYFGPRTNGQADGGYMKPDLRDETLPNNAVVKALDINKKIRPNGSNIDGYYAYADSTVKINNAQLDNGTLDITADKIYANGVVAYMGKDGFKKEADPTTNPVVGAKEIPTGHAVRPEDVEGIKHDKHERNYYYPEGDGDGIFNGEPSNVDPDNGIVDATPLAIEDEPTPTPTPTVEPTPTPTVEPTPTPTVEPTPTPTVEPTPTPTVEPTPTPTVEPTPTPTVEPTPTPTVEPTPTPTVEPTPTPTQPTQPSITDNDTDGRVAYRQRVDDQLISAIDKRQFTRYRVEENRNPISIEPKGGVESLIDVSRGGVSVTHNNDLKVGDIIPVHISYGGLDIQADVEVVSATSHRAGGQFVNLNQATANQLLYLNMVLDEVNNISLK
ncbi:leukotoxin LktA family filamentous adhesin [bacterium]|nr:leukotoxin LktA family filamentous adhesin [bacterium]